MSVSPLMVLGLKAMTANYAALQTTGHNIANANVVGYSRQSAQFATAAGQFSGSGYYGMGVDVLTVSRAHDVFLTREAVNASSQASLDAARLRQLQRLEEVFKTGEAGLGAAGNAFLNTFSQLATRPDDLAVRQMVLGSATQLAARFDQAGRTLDDLQANLNAELQASVAQVNTLARSIADINRQMIALRGQNQPPNDLLDERDRLVASLNALVKVERVDAADGTTGLFVAGGHRLVLGASASDLTLQPDARDPTRMALGLRDGNFVRSLGDVPLGGGTIAGTLQFQNVDLVDARNQIGRLAATIALSVNQQQALGMSLRSVPGQAPPPFFELGPALVTAHASNAKDASGAPLAQVSLQIEQPGALKASDYELTEDPATPGNWLLTRLVAGKPSSDPADRISFDGSTPISFQGLRIEFGSPPPQPGDRFTLQPVSRAANGLKALIEDPRDIAAASPLVAVADAANVGTAAVASLSFNNPPTAPGATARIEFTNDTGSYNWTLFDAGGNLLSSASGVWQAGQPIPAPPADINGFSLQLSGVPRGGDSFEVMPTPPGALASNNGNAMLLAGLRDAALADGRSLTDAWAMALSDMGVRVQGARTSADISGAVARRAEDARTGVAGVNLDEEAARLIQFQQSYQAAAKVLQVAQTLLDTVLQTMGR
jgi:flagellar hook-associated protein 1